jgi:hypothetical protein
LHPHCQVLNHAGDRIFGNKNVDFLSDFTVDRLNRFIQFAIRISTKGHRSQLGGSIAFSHAFDPKHHVSQTFTQTGLGLLKNHVYCLFWKESLRTANLIRDKGIDLRKILSTDGRLRFLLPIRNPLDCAVSNLKTGHVEMLNGVDAGSPLPEVVEAILDEIQWFASLQEDFPDRFFYFLEHSISREMLVRLAEFLDLAPDDDWVSNAPDVMVTKSHYDHGPRLMDFFQDTVRSKFSCFPTLCGELQQFTLNGGDAVNAES